jgi:hypothetical protein
VFPIYIDGVINSLNILEEAYLVVINVLNLVEYVSFSFINAQFAPFYPVGQFFTFLTVGPFFGALHFFSASYVSTVTFSLVHNVYFLSTIFCVWLLFLFVVLIPLSDARDISPYFVFSFFSTFFFLFLLLSSFL